MGKSGGHYLLTDNASIHTHVDISKFVESRGYRRVYLPPYSLELNPIEQFGLFAKAYRKENSCLKKKR